MKDSQIGWTDHTFNPWVGCSKVSEGCKHCYAEALMDQRIHFVKWGDNGTRRRTSDAAWSAPVSWDRQARSQGVRKRVFCASLADIAEDRRDVVEAREDLMRLIWSTPNLDWLLLTKRPENLQRLFCWNWPVNVWIGTSVENTDVVSRIDVLRSVPAAVRFLSVEPLLEPLGELDLAGIDWVIVGGESGRSPRPMQAEWVREIRDQCQAQNVAFFFKQWGGRGKDHGGNVLDGRVWESWPESPARADRQLELL